MTENAQAENRLRPSNVLKSSSSAVFHALEPVQTMERSTASRAVLARVRRVIPVRFLQLPMSKFVRTCINL